MVDRVAESIWHGASLIVSLADVQHIEKHESGGLAVVTKHTYWDNERNFWANHISVGSSEAHSFIQAWCRYRSELGSRHAGQLGRAAEERSMNGILDGLATRLPDPRIMQSGDMSWDAFSEVTRLRAELAEAERKVVTWEERAAQFARNEALYHGLVERIGALFGELAKISDDRGVPDDMLALKVPELVEQLRERLRLAEEVANAANTAVRPHPHMQGQYLLLTMDVRALDTALTAWRIARQEFAEGWRRSR
jgi:hypothetical protein